MRQVFDRFRPGVVFHTAAYKHVPMMEANPIESVRNNVLGTKIVADTAVEFGARRFVLISTDKALNPQAVYGQCKAICEWIVESYGVRRGHPTRFVAVRFGNVLNSAGSVVPIFRRQIERGGPVTVTHPEMTRYFMTIPEAVALVVQAGSIGGRGEIFVLDMGEPVSILELANNMIRLSGKDIAISFVGARAGEKLHEELWGEGELVTETTHPGIRRASRPAVDVCLARGRAVRPRAARRGGGHPRARHPAVRDGARTEARRRRRPRGHAALSRVSNRLLLGALWSAPPWASNSLLLTPEPTSATRASGRVAPYAARAPVGRAWRGRARAGR
jgi:hypothetical protein